jgi:hypothetical protein
MIPTGKEWLFPHGFLIVEEHTGYELTCNGAFVSYNKEIEPLLEFLKIQLGTMAEEISEEVFYNEWNDMLDRLLRDSGDDWHEGMVNPAQSNEILNQPYDEDVA